MNTINPYTQIQALQPKDNVRVREPESVKELSRAEIISSKDLSPDQKLEMLGIKKMNPDELASNLADELLGN